MGSWWTHYKRRCKRNGTSPDKRLLELDVLRADWERYKAIVPKPTMEQMIIACRDHVRVTGEIPSPSGEHVTTFNGTNMGMWLSRYMHRRQTTGTPPDPRLLEVDAIRASWNDRTTRRTDHADYVNTFVDHVVSTGHVPRRRGREVFDNGVSMGTWWSAYMRTCRRTGTPPCDRLMGVGPIRTSWELARRQTGNITSPYSRM
jgi:hypothetical protein